MLLLLSDTQQKLRHAPEHLKISHTHIHTLTATHTQNEITVMYHSPEL